MFLLLDNFLALDRINFFLKIIYQIKNIYLKIFWQISYRSTWVTYKSNFSIDCTNKWMNWTEFLWANFITLLISYNHIICNDIILVSYIAKEITNSCGIDSYSLVCEYPSTYVESYRHIYPLKFMAVLFLSNSWSSLWQFLKFIIKGMFGTKDKG